jgi:large subunit ribosomal protein L31
MKKNIHPQYFKDAKITCACGAVFNIPSTKKEMQIEICSHCHPFYTGKAKIVDVTGQVEKFKQRLEKAKKLQKKKK